MKAFQLFASLLSMIAVLCVASACDSAGDQGEPGEEDAFEPATWFGVNLAGAEFGEGTLPGTYGQQYIYPSHTSLDYYVEQGIRVIRLPFRWERMQRALYGPLDPDELARMETFLAGARVRDVRVILDAHNYGRRHENGQSWVIGSETVPVGAFGDFWKKMAAHFADESAAWGYGLSNEPHDMGPFPWFDAAQAAIDSIRTVDPETIIMVGGDSWSSAARWRQASDNLKNLVDPSDRLVYEAHQYFDDDASGSYNETYEDEGGTPQIGIVRVRPFVEWLEENDKRGFIGEFGIPAGDERWETTLRSFLGYLEANGVGGTYWAGGPWWGDYPLGIEPRNGEDRPQMEVLREFTQ